MSLSSRKDSQESSADNALAHQNFQQLHAEYIKYLNRLQSRCSLEFHILHLSYYRKGEHVYPEQTGFKKLTTDSLFTKEEDYVTVPYTQFVEIAKTSRLIAKIVELARAFDNYDETREFIAELKLHLKKASFIENITKQVQKSSWNPNHETEGRRFLTTIKPLIAKIQVAWAINDRELLAAFKSGMNLLLNDYADYLTTKPQAEAEKYRIKLKVSIIDVFKEKLIQIPAEIDLHALLLSVRAHLEDNKDQLITHGNAITSSIGKLFATPHSESFAKTIENFLTFTDQRFYALHPERLKPPAASSSYTSLKSQIK